MNKEQRKAAAMKTLKTLRDQIEMIPALEQAQLMEIVGELRGRAKTNRLFEPAMQIAIVELQLEQMK